MFIITNRLNCNFFVFESSHQNYIPHTNHHYLKTLFRYPLLLTHVSDPV
jgi:hypothetical protein